MLNVLVVITFIFVTSCSSMLQGMEKARGLDEESYTISTTLPTLANQIKALVKQEKELEQKLASNYSYPTLYHSYSTRDGFRTKTIKQLSPILYFWQETDLFQENKKEYVVDKSGIKSITIKGAQVQHNRFTPTNLFSPMIEVAHHSILFHGKNHVHRLQQIGKDTFIIDGEKYFIIGVLQAFHLHEYRQNVLTIETKYENQDNKLTEFYCQETIKNDALNYKLAQQE